MWHVRGAPTLTMTIASKSRSAADMARTWSTMETGKMSRKSQNSPRCRSAADLRESMLVTQQTTAFAQKPVRPEKHPLNSARRKHSSR